ncbi:MAG: sugar phosphate isomerase/epimerase [Bauldia sp.]|nr:sugar phosphate isomerase/epimerase [Bauldia sp.]
MKRPVELIASYWSIAGDCYASGPTEISPFDFRDRVETARKVGFRGMGFVHADLVSVSDRIGYAEMKAILDDNDMKYVEVEIISDWFCDGEKRKASDVVRADLLRAAEGLGAWHIKVGGDYDDNGNVDWPMDRMIADFRQLCEDAANAGTRIALELMPFSNLRTPEQGTELVQGAGAKNGGIMLDIWHMARGNIDNDRIRRMPKEVVTWVELDDARPEIELPLYIDTIHNRELPGEGSLDIVGFLQAVDDLGYEGPFGVEILSRVHRKLPLLEQVQRVYDTTMAQFTARG